jgi:hypothetical protein
MISKRVDVKRDRKRGAAGPRRDRREAVTGTRKLPPGPDRQSILKEIRKFRARITALMAKAK